MKKLTRTLTMTAVGCALVVFTPTAAAAATIKGTIKANKLNVREGPSTLEDSVGMLSNGTKVRLTCQVWGPEITGTVRTTSRWNRLISGNYISDAYVVRKKNTVLPLCEDGVGFGQVSGQLGKYSKGVSKYGWVAPVSGGVGSGFRSDGRPGHDGVDMEAAKGTALRAAASGKVIGVYCNASNCNVDGSMSSYGCGWYLEIQHKYGYVTRYCHLVQRPSVDVGDHVKAGEVIGLTGSSGNSSGPHLHFEVHSGAPAGSNNAVDPVAFLKKRGVNLKHGW